MSRGRRRSRRLLETRTIYEGQLVVIFEGRSLLIYYHFFYLPCRSFTISTLSSSSFPSFFLHHSPWRILRCPLSRFECTEFILAMPRRLHLPLAVVP